MPKLKPAFLYLIIATVIWGATAPIMKLTLTQIPVFSLVVIRMGVASIILLPFVFKNLKIKKADIRLLIYATLLGTNIHLATFFIGLKLTQAINSAVLIASVPVITLFAAHIYLREKLTSRLIIAASVALLGVVLIIGTPVINLNFRSSLGNLLLLASAACWVGYEIISKKLLKNYSASVITFYVMALGAIFFVPLFIWEILQNPSWISNVDQAGLGGVIYGIIFSSTIAYWTWQKGLSLLPVGEASFFFYLDPVSGIIFSMILLGEKITPVLVLGSILIVSAVFLAERHRKSHPLH